MVILYRLGKFISSKHLFASRKKAVTAAAQTAKAEKKATKTQQAAAATTKQAEGRTESIPRSSTSGIRLTILAKENCWISLKVDGRVVFQSVLTKGRSNNWQGKERMELSLGNAGAVDLEVNGKLISNLGKKGQALKNILITKEGLSTQR